MKIVLEGHGSVLTDTGYVEMDAMIMDGRSLDCGSVACVNNVRNPVVLARKVMENTPHTLLVAHGASQLAVDENLELVRLYFNLTTQEQKL